jgi:hypothetical protein
MVPLCAAIAGVVIGLLGIAVLNRWWQRPERALKSPDQEFFKQFRRRALQVVWPVLISGLITASLGLATVGDEMLSRVHGLAAAHASIRHRESWQSALFAQFGHGSLALLAASALCAWQIVRHVNDIINERVALAGIAKDYAVNPLLSIVTVAVIADLLRLIWAWLRRRRPIHLGPSRMLAAYMKNNAAKDVDEELKKYVLRHPGSVLSPSPWSALSRLLGLFIYASSISLLWWVFNQESTPSPLINVLNWLALLGIGRYVIVADYAGHGRPEALPSKFNHLLTILINSSLLVTLVAALIVEYDYVVWIFLTIITSIALALYDRFRGWRRSARVHALTLIEGYVDGINGGTIQIDLGRRAITQYDSDPNQHYNL